MCYINLDFKICALLEDPAYRGLARDPTEAVESKIILLLKKSSLAEEVCKRLRPEGSRPPRLYGLPKIKKECVSKAYCKQHWSPYLPAGQVSGRYNQSTCGTLHTSLEKLH
jgi:hypothetical protein